MRRTRSSSASAGLRLKELTGVAAERGKTRADAKSFAPSSTGSSVTVTGLMEVFSTENHSSTDSGLSEGACFSVGNTMRGTP